MVVISGPDYGRLMRILSGHDSTNNPTSTVYGIGVDPTTDGRLKGPLIVVIDANKKALIPMGRAIPLSNQVVVFSVDAVGHSLR